MSLRSPVHILMLIAANVLCVLAALMAIDVAGCVASPQGPQGSTYYVSRDGSDSASGRTPRQAWRTMARVNRAELRGGDSVLFRGGQDFAGAALTPEHSGRPGAPIVYGSYGGGRARMPGGVWFRGRHDLAFRRLAISGAEQGISGTGDRIAIEGSRITNTSIAIYAQHGRNWLIRRNVVRRTGDSGLILEGSGHRVERNTILHTGRDRSIPYGKHGIYLKASHTRVARNVIRNFSGNGISSRRRDDVLVSNKISGGKVGIAWFQADRRGGVSRWSANRISSVKEAGFYVSPSDAGGPTIERFVVSGNVVRTSAAFMDFQVAPSRTNVQCNVLVHRRGGAPRRVCSARAAAKLR